jgi:formamidopyrimidine-DNA glycosylase
MPELPDVEVYLEALRACVLNQKLERVLICSPFLLRSATPPISSVEGKYVLELRRIGKRIALGLEGDLWLVIHLMIAGRLHWKDGPAIKKPVTSRPPKNQLAAFTFSNGTLSLTEAGTQRRASLHLVEGSESLDRFNRGGVEVFEIGLSQFSKVLLSENHTLKRSLTDPRLFSGIGNAYSDEILWQAQLSPVAMTQKLSPLEIEKLFNATRETLTKWIEILRTDLTSLKGRPKSKDQTGKSPGQEGGIAPAPSISFPEKVTAFRPEMAVHGKYGQPCPRCGNKVQRIRYASNETNYCPHCQTGGKLLADRALSRLLRSDWPRTVEELEEVRRE